MKTEKIGENLPFLDIPPTQRRISLIRKINKWGEAQQVSAVYIRIQIATHTRVNYPKKSTWSRDVNNCPLCDAPPQKAHGGTIVTCVNPHYVGGNRNIYGIFLVMEVHLRWRLSSGVSIRILIHKLYAFLQPSMNYVCKPPLTNSSEEGGGGREISGSWNLILIHWNELLPSYSIMSQEKFSVWLIHCIFNVGVTVTLAKISAFPSQKLGCLLRDIHDLCGTFKQSNSACPPQESSSTTECVIGLRLSNKSSGLR